jgi:hypothetical protein
MAGVAADPVVDLAVVRNASPIVHAILALVLLVAATVLGVYKPLGMTAYGRRKYDEERQAASAASSATVARPGTARAIDAGSAPRWMYLFGIIAIGIVVLFVLLHFTGGLRH